MSILGIIALTPAVAALPVESDKAEKSISFAFSLSDAAIALAAVRAGAIGVVNLELADTQAIGLDAHIAGVLQQLFSIAKSDRFGIKCDISQVVELPRTLAALTGKERSEQSIVVVSLGEKTTPKQLKKAIETLQSQRLRTIVEVVCESEAKMAEASGADAIIAKGQESAARVGEQTTFVLLQQCLQAVKIPVWAEGGVGMHTAAACHVAGAAGVVLGSQLLLTPESNLPITVKQKLSSLDGTETTLLGDGASGAYRVYSRSAHAHESDAAANKQDAAAGDAQAAKKTNKPQEVLPNDTRRWLMNKLAQERGEPLDRLYVIGQDVAFACDLTRRFSSVAGIISAIEMAVEEHTQIVTSQNALARVHHLRCHTKRAFLWCKAP